jgi:hypothetical protein
MSAQSRRQTASRQRRLRPAIDPLTIRLIRNDYDPETIPGLDVDSCTVKSFARPSWGDLKNSARIGYVSRDAGFIEKTAQAQDLAGIEVHGGEVLLRELTMRGLSNPANAQQAAARALAALAYPLATVTIEADRSAWALRPGAVFNLVWDPLGIDGMVCRAVRVGTGRLDSGKIEIEAMEDNFAVDWTGYSDPPASGWEDPSGDVSTWPMAPEAGHRRSTYHSSRRRGFSARRSTSLRAKSPWPLAWTPIGSRR